jgi:hypothetical protein
MTNLRRSIFVVMLSFVAACAADPALRNAPHPSAAGAAGVAAVAAAAMTMASPQGAQASAEAANAAGAVPDDRGIKVKQTVPSAVFDRLDEAEARPAPVLVSDPPADPVVQAPEPGQTTTQPGSHTFTIMPAVITSLAPVNQ